MTPRHSHPSRGVLRAQHARTALLTDQFTQTVGQSATNIANGNILTDFWEIIFEITFCSLLSTVIPDLTGTITITMN